MAFVFPTFGIFPRKNLLTFVEDVFPMFDPNEFPQEKGPQEELSPPPGARSADDDTKYLRENIDPRIFLRFPDKIMEMDENIEILREDIDPITFGCIPMSKRRWDI